MVVTRFLPVGQLHGEAAVGVEDEAGAVEDELVLAADAVEEGQGQPGFADAGDGERSAGVSCLSISKGEPLGTSSSSAPVSARHSVTSGNHMSSQIGTPRRTPRKASGPGSGPGCEDALFVERAVIGQLVLAGDAGDLAAFEQEGGVVQLAMLGERRADDQRRAAIGGGVGEPVDALPSRLRRARASAPGPRADSR